MNILVIHEVDWVKKVIFEPHHLAELFSLNGNNVYVIDCRDARISNLLDGFHTKIIQNYHRVYDDASITLIRPPSLLIKGLNRITSFLTCTKIIKKIIIEKKIDIIFLYGVATNGIQAIHVAKQLGIPIVFRALDVAHGLVKIPIVRQLAKKCEKMVLYNATKVFATTPELSRYAIQMGAEKNRVTYFPLGVNTKHFRPQTKDLQLEKDLGISKSDKVIVFMGTLYDFAGLEEIISKFNILKNNLKSVKLLIVGGGPSLSNLKSLIKNKNLENDVIITGFIPQMNVPKYIALADICINPFQVNYVTDSILPTKILEYLACEKSVLSTPLRGTKELLPNEDFGIMYSTSNNFIETLSNLLSNPKKLRELGKKGYDYVRQNHDWNVLSANLLNDFEKVTHEV